MAENTRKHKNKHDRQVDKIKRSDNKKKDTPYIAEQKKIQAAYSRENWKKMAKVNEKRFEDKYWMTSSQYKYKKQKEYLAKNKS